MIETNYVSITQRHHGSKEDCIKNNHAKTLRLKQTNLQCNNDSFRSAFPYLVLDGQSKASI